MTWTKMAGWEGPFRFVPKGWGDICPDKGGVYRLLALNNNSADTSRMQINRICDQDRTGTLYIGHATHLVRRIGQLEQALLNGQSGHGAGILLRQTTTLSDLLPIEKLAFTWRCDDHPLEAEAELIRAYVNAFGEAPPLNRQRRARDE